MDKEVNIEACKANNIEFLRRISVESSKSGLGTGTNVPEKG